MARPQRASRTTAGRLDRVRQRRRADDRARCRLHRAGARSSTRRPAWPAQWAAVPACCWRRSCGGRRDRAGGVRAGDRGDRRADGTAWCVNQRLGGTTAWQPFSASRCWPSSAMLRRAASGPTLDRGRGRRRPSRAAPGRSPAAARGWLAAHRLVEGGRRHAADRLDGEPFQLPARPGGKARRSPTSGT